MNFSALLRTIPSLLAIMLIGYTGARSGKLGPGFTKSASYLVSNILLSCSIFNSICGNVPDLSGDLILKALLIMTASLAVCFIVSGISTIIVKRRGYDPAPFELSLSIVNALLIGLPIIQQVYGDLAVLYTGLFAVPLNLLLYTYGVWRLDSTGSSAGGGFKMKTIMTPCTIVTLIAIFLFAFRVRVPGVILQFSTYVGSATVPMSMIVIGTMMASEGLMDAFFDKRVYLLCFIRLILTPLIAWPVISMLTDDIVLIRTAVLLAACPCGMVIPILSLQYGHDPMLSSRSVLVSTLFSMLTLPMWVYFVG